MDVSVVRCSQPKFGKTEFAFRELGFCDSRRLFSRKSKIGFVPRRSWRSAGLQVSVKAMQSEVAESKKFAGETPITTRSKSQSGARLFVGLPLDVVSECNTVNHARAIAAGLKALKLLGVEGVELPVWWGVAEKEAMGNYNWSGYLALADMVQSAGLKLRVSLCFHGSKQAKVLLPQWVSQIGESQPSILFTDRSGQRYRECLSLGVDDLPVLDGKTPLQVYKQFCESFKSSFSDLLGSTITDISIGLGPYGELRYPSYQSRRNNRAFSGVGEFQCYDEHMLRFLREHAEASGNPKWGLSGPHDVPRCEESPNSNNFFKEHGGSWETPYGDFFLSCYSNQLLSHGDRMLSMASSTFSNSPVTVSGKVPLMHSWYKTRSHPSELTSGFYNTANRDGYHAVAEMFGRNSCRMVLPGMDLSDEFQRQESQCSPETLLSQIKEACRKHGVEVYGENSLVSGTPGGGFDQIKKNLSGNNNVVVNSFTYQRMGAYFFSPEHFPSFTRFVRTLNEEELCSDDDLPMKDEEEALVSPSTSRSEPGKTLEMQAA